LPDYNQTGCVCVCVCLSILGGDEMFSVSLLLMFLVRISCLSLSLSLVYNVSPLQQGILVSQACGYTVTKTAKAHMLLRKVPMIVDRLVVSCISCTVYLLSDQFSLSLSIC